MESNIGFAHFLEHTDALGRTVLLVLLTMSIASWYLIVTKAITNSLVKQRADAFLKQFWAADSLHQIRTALLQKPRDQAFAQLAHDALEAASNSEKHGMQKLAAPGG